MKFTKFATLMAGGLVALSAASLALPRHVNVTRSAFVDATPETILDLASSSDGFQTFNPYRVLDPELSIASFGPPAGVGSGFRFDGKDGTGTQMISEIRADAVIYSIDLGSRGQPLQTIQTLAATGGTKVIWRVESDMGFNPVARVIGLFLEDMMGPTLELGLENLGKAAA